MHEAANTTFQRPTGGAHAMECFRQAAISKDHIAYTRGSAASSAYVNEEVAKNAVERKRAQMRVAKLTTTSRRIRCTLRWQTVSVAFSDSNTVQRNAHPLTGKR